MGFVSSRRVMLACLLVLEVMCASQSIAAERTVVIPPGQEARFETLLNSVSSELPAGWEWLSAKVESDSVTVLFGPAGEAPTSCDQAQVCLVLVHSSKAAPGDLAGGDFAVRVAHEEETQDGLAARLASKVSDGLRGWREGGQSTPWTEGRPAEGVPWLLWIVFGMSAMALAAVVVLERRTVRWRWFLLGGAWAAASFAASWILAPHGVFHDNHHGYLFLVKVQTGAYPDHTVVSSFLAFVQVVRMWFGGGDELFWGVNTAMMALSAPLLGWWIARATRRVEPGILAAVMWGISPIALRMGPTDSLFTFSLVLLLGAALLLARAMSHLGERNWLGLVHLFGAVLLGLSLGQTHIAAMFLPPVVLPLALALVPVTMRRQKWALIGACGAVALLMVPHAFSIIELALEITGGKYIILGNLLSAESWGRRMLWNWEWVAWTVVPLAGWGLASMLIWNRRSGIWTTIGWVALLVGVLPIATCLHLHVVLETPIVCITTGLAAIGAWEVCRLISRFAVGRIAKGACWVVVGVLGSSVLLPWSAVQFQPPGTQEYRILVDTVLPYLRQHPDSHIMFPGSIRIKEIARLPLFMDWLKLQLPGAHIYSTEGEMVQAGEAGERLVYVGLSCVIPVEDVGEPGCSLGGCGASDGPLLSPRCLKETDGLNLEPVMTFQLRNAPAGFLCVSFPQGPLGVGLYRVLDQAR